MPTTKKKAVTRTKAAAKRSPAKAKPKARGSAPRTATRRAAAPAARKPAARKPAARKRPAAMFQKIAFTMLPVEDPTRARAFYEDILGFRRGLASPDGTWTEYDLPGGGCLALFRHPDPSARGSKGGGSVAFEVADLDALNQRLVAAGVAYMGDMVHGPRCRMSNILDSEGNGLILHQLARGA